MTENLREQAQAARDHNAPAKHDWQSLAYCRALREWRGWESTTIEMLDALIQSLEALNEINKIFGHLTDYPGNAATAELRIRKILKRSISK